MKTSFEDQYGCSHAAVKEIARGGQGVVWQTEDPRAALKLELDPRTMEIRLDPADKQKYEYLRRLPIPEGLSLTLPSAVLTDASGYVMPWLEDMVGFETAFTRFRYEETGNNAWLAEMRQSVGEDEDGLAVVEELEGYLATGGRQRRLEAYFRCACILSQLHSRGLVYCDLSPKNAFLSSARGSDIVWLIDADNLDFQDRLKQNCFTPGYGAPEVLKGGGCSMYSDCWSFAVALFQTLTGTHPFMGPLAEGEEDDFVDAAEDRAYSGQLPWICDEEDDRNQTDTVIPVEQVLSLRMMGSFQRVFGAVGRERRTARTTMFEWADVLAEELDHSVRCANCGMDYDGGAGRICPWCDTVNRVVTLRARTWESDRETGPERVFLCGVCPGRSIEVPLRLIRGLRMAEADKQAFTIESGSDSVLLRDFNGDLQFSDESGGTAGRIELRDGGVLWCTEDPYRFGGARTIRIEVNYDEAD